MTIGSADGEDPYLFHRVWDMATLSDGRIVVADAGSEEVRALDPSGVHLASWGGQGEGPGEFRSLSGVARWPGDSVAAWEFHSNRGARCAASCEWTHALIPATRSLLALEREESGVDDSDDEIPLPETLPAFDQVVGDAVDHLWVREYRVPGSDAPHRLWTVFDPEGRVLGHVETPPGLGVFEIGADFILGLAIGDLGVQHVQVWPLRREGRVGTPV